MLGEGPGMNIYARSTPQTALMPDGHVSTLQNEISELWREFPIKLNGTESETGMKKYFETDSHYWLRNVTEHMMVPMSRWNQIHTGQQRLVPARSSPLTCERKVARSFPLTCVWNKKHTPKSKKHKTNKRLTKNKVWNHFRETVLQRPETSLRVCDRLWDAKSKLGELSLKLA